MTASGGERRPGVGAESAGAGPAALTAPPGPDDPATTRLHTQVLTWYDRSARDLPWRATDRTPWGVLVSEVMLAQTPVARVLPVWTAWMERWPTPASLAAEPPGEILRAWGRMGYPRRALRLHEAARVIVDRHGGDVPRAYDDLRTLPGVGDYTAAAVASFAYDERHPVLDTNVRRVFARLLGGNAAPGPALSAAERRRARSVLPADPPTAARWAVAVMELGALLCTARTPRCDDCPVRTRCVWRLAGSPPPAGPARRAQSWQGSDRMVRGRLMQVLRDAPGPVTAARLAAAWDDPIQRARALDALVADGLVEVLPRRRYSLPGVVAGSDRGTGVRPGNDTTTVVADSGASSGRGSHV